jgi:hypothetical protein
MTITLELSSGKILELTDDEYAELVKTFSTGSQPVFIPFQQPVFIPVYPIQLSPEQPQYPYPLVTIKYMTGGK